MFCTCDPTPVPVTLSRPPGFAPLWFLKDNLAWSNPVRRLVVLMVLSKSDPDSGKRVGRISVVKVNICLLQKEASGHRLADGPEQFKFRIDPGSF